MTNAVREELDPGLAELVSRAYKRGYAEGYSDAEERYPEMPQAGLDIYLEELEGKLN